MEQKTLKKIRIGELRIARIGFGTLYISIQRGFGPARSNSLNLLRSAKEFGIQFFDTADSYGNGSTEEALKDALYPYKNIVIATKGGYRHQKLGKWIPDARPEKIRTCLEGSLKRLRKECIDLYQLHCPDNKVPYAESVGMLVRMQKEGKIKHIGISNVNINHIKIAESEAKIVSVQNAYNIQHQRASDVLDYCLSKNMVFIPWMPLGDGSISWDSPLLKSIAQRHRVTPSQIALAALFHRSPAILPIPGTSNLDHLRENVFAQDISLDQKDLSKLWKINKT